MDKAKLSQWRGYCPPSFGYSIGFNAEKLRAKVKPQGFELHACKYDHQSQLDAMKVWARNSVDDLLASCPTNADHRQFAYDNCNKFLSEFVKIAPYMKDHSFSDEREWRLVGFASAKDPGIALRPGKSVLVPYVPIKLGLCEDDSPLWNVQVGPTPHIELAMEGLSTLFQKAKFANGVTRTNIPYRDW